MKFSLAVAILPLAANAFPSAFAPNARTVKNQLNAARPRNPTLNVAKGDQLSARQKSPITQDPLHLSKSQTNCGPTPCLHFDESQLVSQTGDHAYASPAADEIRGPCPGLNAASNHGYLPRSGIASIEETVAGLGAMYAMSPELAVALAAYSIAVTGNLIEMVWSIGGPLPQDELAGGLLGNGYGLSYSHNAYEGDASIGRNDAFTNNGDAHSLNATKFQMVHDVGGKEDRYTLDKFRQRFESVQDEAIANNPYYFTGAFSTVVVVPAAYNFVINFMSNHSKEEPSGYLDSYNFKSFFAITGKSGKFKWQKGQERMPRNWYRRPLSNPYTANDVGMDVAIGYAAYPRTLKFGGNTGKTNSFVGVDVADLTGGALNAKTLLEGDNFSCFAFVLAQQGIPDFLNLPLKKLNKATSLVSKAFAPILSKLDCPNLDKMDQSLLNQFPGRHYRPNGKATNY